MELVVQPRLHDRASFVWKIFVALEGPWLRSATASSPWWL